jgi:hypothetical protein
MDGFGGCRISRMWVVNAHVIRVRSSSVYNLFNMDGSVTLKADHSATETIEDGVP